MKNFILKLYDSGTKATRWLAIVAAVSIGGLMAVNFIDIVGTKFFLTSIPGAMDISEELMVLLTLLPIAYIALERGHIRITLVEDRMNPKMRFAMRIFQYGVAILITGFITSRVFVQFHKSLHSMQLKEGIDLPIWPANVAVVISFAFLTLVWVLLLAKTLIDGVEK